MAYTLKRIALLAITMLSIAVAGSYAQSVYAVKTWRVSDGLPFDHVVDLLHRKRSV